MILAVEETHRLKFIHRDIKPDNFLISASGHLKISDFGLAFDGHWSHDASYYNWHRHSLVRKLQVPFVGDEKDRNESQTIKGQLERAKAIMAEAERHDRGQARDQDLRPLIGWRDQHGYRATAKSIVGTSQYMAPEVISGAGPVDVFGRHVFPDDAEDIKGHRWFRELAWDRLHSTSPPFIPRITSQDDTQYFNESEPLEEFSDSYASAYATPEAVEAALKGLPPVMQEMALQLIAEPYDSSKLRQIDFEIETAGLFSRQEQEILKQFGRLYGHKLHKRPRDRILRDRKLRDVVMDVRKTSAFAGYTWRRMRPGGYTAPAQPRFGI
ncbi:hypothetical protein K4F52_007375 [Lecanicillium sp. MT-2017a]|nr:hypothetical protein K4F52_007375 [Lecanicillium sp. MT-2017a]